MRVSNYFKRPKLMKIYRVSLLLLLYFIISLHQSSATATKKPSDNENDKQALLAFKNNLNNDSHVFGSWNESTPYCKWEGVSCCRRHRERVCAISLPLSNLMGSISPYVGNLTFLKVLNLTENHLHGTIPLSVSYLNQLQKLGLSNNSFSGTFLSNLYNCTEMVHLSLSYNQLHGKLPPWLGHFKKLEILYLGVNNFTGELPLSIGNLSSLIKLQIGDNNLVGSIPGNLVYLNQLENLNLDENNLSGEIPESIFNFTFLSALYLDSNKLQGGLPKTLGTHLPNLKILELDLNQLIGEIPASLSNVSSIQILDLGGNKFSGIIPAEIGKHCPQYFSVYENELIAKVTADWNFINFFTNCSGLEYFLLGDNKLEGSIPNTIANFTTQLQYLDLTNNYLTGEIPKGIGNLVGLVELALLQNQLTGTIPVTIGKLQNLEEIFIDGNMLSGSIPFSIGNLTNLIVLWLANNRLVGSIPSSFGNLTRLTAFSLAHNLLTGMLPNSIFNIPTLSRGLDLSYNFLSGTIPKEVGNLENIAELYFSANNLSGELPEQLAACQILTILYLDSNSFQGHIPSFLSKLKGLEVLNLSHNYFSGVIPEELGLLNALQELYLGGNNLSGDIPLTLENLTDLWVLDISYNNFEGPVPTEGVFSNRSALILTGNNKLCGGSPELNLPKCFIQLGRKHSPMLVKLVIPIVGTLLFLALLLLAFLVSKWKRKLTRESTTYSILTDRLSIVTYGELATATNGFSDSNLIGAGKYGRVYMGILQSQQEGSTNKDSLTVAIKVFNLQQLGSSKSFLAECKALRIIRHRNLIQIITCCSSIDYQGQDFKALVFDYVANGNLHKWLHPETEKGPWNPLSLIQRLNIAIDIANALDYLHHDCQPSVVHCDLKPSNILLREDMSACVGDFGLAKLLPDPISKSLVDSESSIGIRGSIGYVPPEYGEGGPVSTTGDIYSFGVLLLELFTGRNPTEYMFKDGLTLHTFVSMAFPERVMEVIDSNLIAVDVLEIHAFNKMWECLVSLMEVGLTCSKQSPAERMSMGDVAIQLHRIRDAYLANNRKN